MDCEASSWRSEGNQALITRHMSRRGTRTLIRRRLGNLLPLTPLPPAMIPNQRTIQRRGSAKIASSYISYSRVELRLYRKTDCSLPGVSSPVFPYDPIFLPNDCPSAQDCFKRLCEQIKTDCSFMVFHLPEDMSLAGSVRIDRGSLAGEETFKRVLEIFQKAKKFPGEPQYRSVEVEVGLDMSVDG
jgi:hypothetical protein